MESNGVHMHRAPKWKEFGRYPVTTMTIVMAVLLSVAWWTKMELWAIELNPRLGDGELWRLVFASLLHAHVVHLALGVWAIWIFGTLIEATWGSLRLLAILLVLAIGSCATEYAIGMGNVGMSGLSFGLMTLVGILGRSDERFYGTVTRTTLAVFTGWFVLCIVSPLLRIWPMGPFSPLAGAMLGTLIALAVAQARRRAVFVSLAGVLILASLIGATVARPWVNLSHRGVEEAALGYKLLLRGQNEESRNWLQKASRLNPYDANYFFDLGTVCRRLGYEDEARFAYERACKLEPNNRIYQEAAQSGR